MTNEARGASGSAVPARVGIVVAVVALVIATAGLTATVVGRSGFGMMGGVNPGARGGGMMGGGSWGGAMMGNGTQAVGPAPGSAGFVAGTVASPRVVRISATAGLRFLPDAVAVQQGETITFEVTSVGPLVHEFMVGPAADVAADTPGTPEVADIGMMETRSLTYTVDGPGPYAFACHVAGHYEAGMEGTIVVLR